MPVVTNIAAYKFAALQDLKRLRDRLIALCKQWQLKGTILLSTEGINLFVAGSQTSIHSLLSELRTVSGLDDLSPKFSESREQPFHRMLVKIKREIIAFGVSGIDPIRQPAPKISPTELKRWLDEGRPVTLLDTRNEYEIQLGTFERALNLGIGHFRQFPDAVRSLPEDLKQQPIVMFCTGGIRCEKAAPYMQRAGFEQVFQLDGGILKYFEECGSDHYRGECFVFDQRVGLDPGLHESETTQCYVCQTPLGSDDRLDERFIEGRSCRYCYVSDEQKSAVMIEERHASLRQITTPLPGREPYENYRPLNVSAKFDGRKALEFLCNVLPNISRDEWQQVCDDGRLLKRTRSGSNEASSRDHLIRIAADDVVSAGDRLLHVQRSTVEPDVNVDIQIVYEDDALIIVNKPAPLPMHPCGRFNRNTLQYFLGKLYHPQSPRPAHRLDANTSGLVLFARTRHFARVLQQQFGKAGSDEIEKQYLARALGHPVANEFECRIPTSDEPGPIGSRCVDLNEGLNAHTQFKVLSRDPDGTSLLQVTPYTGRTNQIRIHLWHLGHPICGDPLYLPGQQLGQVQTVAVNDPPLCLLARRLSFRHPVSGKRMVFEAMPLSWCRALWHDGARRDGALTTY